MTFWGLLNNTFTIYRKLRLPDGMGGWSEAWAELGTTAGRVRPRTGTEREVADLVERQVSHVLYCPADTDIARGDLVECGSFTAEVLGVREPSLAGHHLEVDLEQREYEESEAGS